MIAGLSGSLLSHDAVERMLVQADGPEPRERARLARRRLAAWHHGVRVALGPTATARQVFDRCAAPLAAHLGYRVVPIATDGAARAALLEAANRPYAVLFATRWGEDAATAWRDAVRHGIGAGVRWCYCVTGPALRVIDAARTFSRRFAEFDLDTVVDDEQALGAMWGLLSADTVPPEAGDRRSALDAAVRLSEVHRAEVRGALQQGVHAAITELLRAFAQAARRVPLERAFDEALTVIYRMLFLLFAEARGLVPQWHPLYRDSYTIGRLRGAVERNRHPRGLWEALQAISRLAHHGCRAGALRVPPFNGRLFSPAHAPLADYLPLDDRAVRGALLALTLRSTHAGTARIAYGDLGVEQLGGIYERLLDFEPSREDPGGAPALVRAERRKATGAFYTPRSVTEYLVRRTLAPLVADASSDGILSLRVLDPAMGSGAFLVAACRYLAGAYEAALVNEGMPPTEITAADRAGFRRIVAQRCLYGVDINPMAVQLARLSLWLATLAADRPLTFLDHHLRVGNSLAGASIADVLRRRPGKTARTRPKALPLFAFEDLDAALRQRASARLAIALEPGDTLAQVRAKERALAELQDATAPLARWTSLLNLWCCGWFDEDPALGAAFGALADRVLHGDASLPAHVADSLLARIRAVAEREQFFHWSLEFPEVLGGPESRSGFDAVIGNPPWEMLRADRGDTAHRAAARAGASRLAAFARASGAFLFDGNGHLNLFQLFVDRALSLVRTDGRIGLVLPWGFAVDLGCAAYRRHLFERTTIDTFTSLENRDGLFPIHRSVKILLLTTTKSGSSSAVPCRLRMRSPSELDTLPDTGAPDAVVLPRALIERLTGPALAIPEIRTPADLEIVSAVAAVAPPLGDPDGWNVHFGRELNATEDSRHFNERGLGLPVVEGKQIAPFAVDLTATRNYLPERTAERLLDPVRTYRRVRLAYRDVASATNRLTLIAAVVPAGVVTTHTVFCLREGVGEEVHHFLCGIFNSYVANYLVRLRVTTHVSASIIERLPVPRVPVGSEPFDRIVRLSRRLTADGADGEAAAELQALSADLYGLNPEHFGHVLSTFPLVPAGVRQAALRRLE